MHKISVSLRVVVIIVATALVVAGCMNPMQGSSSAANGDSGTGSLSIQVGRGVGASTWQPSSDDRTPESYKITGAGPAGTSFEVTVNDGQAANVPALLAGNWQVTVDGFNGANGEGARVATGVATASVSAGAVKSLTVNVGPTTGEGTFDVTIDWSDARRSFANASSDVTASGSLRQGTEVTPIGNTGNDDSWTVNDEFDAGYYIFEWELKNSNVQIYTIRSVVRIMGDGLITSPPLERLTDGAIKITADDVTRRGDIALNIILDMNDPTSLAFGGDLPILVTPGEEFSVSLNEVPDGARLEWAIGLDVLEGETGSTISLKYSDLKPGWNEVSVIVFEDDRMSSLGFRVEALVPNATVHPGGSIQAAIDNASDGDVIEVRAGTYSGFTVPAGKSLTIYGPNAGVAGVDHNAPAAIINGLVRFNEASTIDGFTIRGEGSSTDRLVIPTNTSGSVIRNNIIENAFRGIQGDVFGRPTNLTITGNLITTDYGVVGTEDATGLVISGNTFDNEDEAVGLGVGFALEGFDVNSLGMFDEIVQNNTIDGAPVIDYRSGTAVIGRPAVKILDGDVAASYHSSIAWAIHEAAEHDVIFVPAGTHQERVLIWKPITILGPNAGIAGNSVDRGPEAIIKSPVDEDGALVSIYNGADDATIDGLSFKPNSDGIFSVQSNTTVQNNVFHGSGGIDVRLSQIGSTGKEEATTGNITRNNLFLDGAVYHSIYYQAAGGVIENNELRNVNAGIQVQPYKSNASGVVKNNEITSYASGLYYNYANGTAEGTSTWVFEGNTVRVPDVLPNWEQLSWNALPRNWDGIRVETYYHENKNGTPAKVTFKGNTIDGNGATSVSWLSVNGVYLRLVDGDTSENLGNIVFENNDFANVENVVGKDSGTAINYDLTNFFDDGNTVGGKTLDNLMSEEPGFDDFGDGAQQMIVAAVIDELWKLENGFSTDDIEIQRNIWTNFMFGGTPGIDQREGARNGTGFGPATTDGVRSIGSPFYVSFWSENTPSVQKLDTVESFWFVLKNNRTAPVHTDGAYNAPWLTIYTYPSADQTSGWYGSRLQHLMGVTEDNSGTGDRSDVFINEPKVYYVGSEPTNLPDDLSNLPRVELFLYTGKGTTGDGTPITVNHDGPQTPIKALALITDSGDNRDYDFTMIASGFKMTGDGIVVEESFDYRNSSADPEHPEI